MCGIFACLRCCSSGRGECLKAVLLERLKRRGPDCVHEACVPVAGGELQLDLLGTLLSMRGEITPQPLANEAGDWLLWNGNIFGGGIEVKYGENDTARLLEALTPTKSPPELLKVLSSIHGPWSFIFWQVSSSSLWFGRDVFGRRSLLWHLPSHTADTAFALSSVGSFDSDTPAGYWFEVPALGVFQLMCTTSDISSASLVCYPWMQGDISFQSQEGIEQELRSFETCFSISCITEYSLQVFFPPLNTNADTSPHTQTSEASIAPQQDILSNHRGSTASPTHSSSTARGGGGLAEELEKEPCISCGTDLSFKEDEHVQDFLHVLQAAVQSRVLNAPHVRTRMAGKLSKNSAKGTTAEESEKHCPNPNPKTDEGSIGDGCAKSVPGSTVYGRAKVAVLFSGGVDSAVLAALVDRCLEPSEEIDVINVAFELRNVPTQSPGRFDVPDRISGLACLKQLNPNRIWNFITVDVSLDEVNKMRSEHVAQLVYPRCTVLDDSIGCALWFAARGEGHLHTGDPTHPISYRSSARTLLVGIGADEQLAGYSRHRTKFRSSGLEGVCREVEMDTKRLAKRNLDRDDRCTADHQREAQYPFLDEQVVAFLQQLPMSVKADLSLPRGVGEKQLLRAVARVLRCHSAASLPKRAIQFGSRMAQLSGSSNSREHGGDACYRLIPKYSSQ